MRTDVRWHHGQTLAAGQVAEFKVWAELVRQSMGGLHMFLPLRDLGIDGVVHRMADGSYVAVQVKARTELTPAGQVHITVTASSLMDDQALVLATLVDGEELGRFVLVVDEATFRSLAAHDMVEGREYLTAAFGLYEGGRSRWAPYLVARERLAERLGAAGLAGGGRAEGGLTEGVRAEDWPTIPRRGRGHPATGGGGVAQSLSTIPRPGDGGSARSTRLDAAVSRTAGEDGWLGQGARRESRLREAVELPAGSVDLYMCAGVESRFGPV